MTRLALLVAALFIAAPAEPQRIDIALSNFRFTPATIHLKHGQPYTLHLASSGSHSFGAKAFFAAATVAAEDRERIMNGKVEVGGSTPVDVRLTAPAPGRYPVVCTHLLHASFGMKGVIVVD